MKQKLEDYFKRKYARWREYKNSFPMISWDEDVPSFIYVGEINNEIMFNGRRFQKMRYTSLVKLRMSIISSCIPISKSILIHIGFLN